MSYGSIGSLEFENPETCVHVWELCCGRMKDGKSHYICWKCRSYRWRVVMKGDNGNRWIGGSPFFDYNSSDHGTAVFRAKHRIKRQIKYVQNPKIYS